MMYKQGSFEQVNYSNLLITHQVTYKELEVDSLVWEINLCQYSNNDISIAFKIEPERYERFMAEMVSRGIERPSTSDRDNHVILFRAARTELESLLMFLNKAKEAKDCISRLENIDETFDEIMISITRASQSVDNSQASSRLENVVAIAASHGHSSILQQHIERLNSLDTFLGRTPIRFIGDELVYREHDAVQGFARGGHIASAVRYLQQAIRDQQNNNTEDAAFQNALDNSFAEHYGHTSATYLPSRNTVRTAPAPAPAPPPPPTDEEHKQFKLEEKMGFICPISLEIMTDPVSIIKHEMSGSFERSAIENWLVTNNRHPLTNLILADKRLVPNIELKAAIEGYNTSKLKI